MRVLKITLTVAVAGLFIAVVTRTQQKEMSDAEYTKQALLAAPEAVAKDAGGGTHGCERNDADAAGFEK